MIAFCKEGRWIHCILSRAHEAVCMEWMWITVNNIANGMDVDECHSHHHTLESRITEYLRKILIRSAI